MTNLSHDDRRRCQCRCPLVYRCPRFGQGLPLIKAEDRILAPDLVMAETASALWKAIRFAGLNAATAAEGIAPAGGAFHALVSTRILADRALGIALDLRHPVYDCFYLALAQTRGTRPITVDSRLLPVCACTRFAKLVRSL
jgi:predicted nucleic acid-binding protein